MTDRVAVLDTEAAIAILTTVREAHTGEPPTGTGEPETPQVADDVPDTRDDTTPPQLTPAPPVASAAAAKLRILGGPHVEDLVLPGRPLRRKAAELAVYLACHPDGADTDTIAEYLFPEARRRQAKQQVHTNASNLRHVLTRAGGPHPDGYLLKRGTSARYRLDPTTVHVDLWQLRDLLNQAQLTSPPARTELLRQACDLYTAPLAHGCDYEWVEPHREKARQWATDAHLQLAQDLITADPQAAADITDKAIKLDPYNEQLYHQAMHARHALHDSEGIRALLRAVTTALNDLDAEPTDTTIDLANRLRANLAA
jgi:DNA-binding SARP family transcriptional activator